MLGLGNPGAEYDGTRHNAGAATVAVLVGRLQTRRRGFRGPAWVAEAQLPGRSLLLARPKTYMNDSGAAGARLLGQFGLGLEAVVVVHDELDLELGQLRLRPGGGTAGHNGLRSLQTHWRSQDFARVRIGIGRPPPGEDPIDYVLARPGGGEARALERSLERAADAVLAIADHGLEQAMTEFNRRWDAEPDLDT
ncbi:MAG: aminoacyl-tRNA hydrolase [Candidatus Dormibacteria bacterium]